MVHVNAPISRSSHKRLAAGMLIFVVFPAVAAGYYFGYNVGKVTVLITDDVIRDFEHLNITFSQIQVHSAGALTPSKWVSVDLATTTIDLTDLANNLTATLGLDSITAGKYSQLRILVESAQGVLTTGESVDVIVPSGELRTETPFELKPQGAVTLLVRLQVMQAAGTYSLRPAFGGVTTES